MTVAFYVSGHGFGHASRQIEIINALWARQPDVRVLVSTAAASWLFERTLRAPAVLQRGEIDTGAVQRGSLDVDVAQTLDRAVAFHVSLEARAEAEAGWLTREGAGLVVGDVPPLAFAAAARAGIPSIAIANFTWDWIYDAYAEARARAPGLGALLRRCYAQAAAGWRLPMHGGFEAFASLRDLPWVARHARHPRTEVRQRLGLPRDVPLVLVSFGGFGAAGIDIAAAAASVRGVAGLVMTSYDDAPPVAGVWRVDEDRLYRDGLRYEDLVGAVDVVASKPGYGIISECVANGAALLYTSRGRFREYDVLVSAMPQVLRCTYLDARDLVAGRWRDAVVRLLSASAPSSSPPTNGATVAADLLLAQLGARPRSVQPGASRPGRQS